MSATVIRVYITECASTGRMGSIVYAKGLGSRVTAAAITSTNAHPGLTNVETELPVRTSREATAASAKLGTAVNFVKIKP